MRKRRLSEQDSQPPLACAFIDFKKAQVFGEVLLSRWHNGELAISSEMGKSSSISEERDGGNLAFTRYSHLSRHLVALIQSDPKDCSVEKASSTPDCVVQRRARERLSWSPLCQGHREAET